jgi:hypothetical protein
VTKYRIKVVVHSNGITWYIPQSRCFLFWSEVVTHPNHHITSLEEAEDLIRAEKAYYLKVSKTHYIIQ